jgi:hypothetical protein
MLPRLPRLYPESNGECVLICFNLGLYPGNRQTKGSRRRVRPGTQLACGEGQWGIKGHHTTWYWKEEGKTEFLGSDLCSCFWDIPEPVRVSGDEALPPLCGRRGRGRRDRPRMRCSKARRGWAVHHLCTGNQGAGENRQSVVSWAPLTSAVHPIRRHPHEPFRQGQERQGYRCGAWL